MSNLEKLTKLMESLRIQQGSVLGIDAQSKKKEFQITLFHFTDLICSPAVQLHKDFPNHISQAIDVALHVCDSPDSNMRLGGDESLTKILKALSTLHSNRVLVELCKRIKKNGSVRITKLSLTRFADLCHLIRPQKRRAYVANLLNTILLIAKRPEDGIHESLSLFLQKVMPVLGLYVYDNEVKALLKTFLNNTTSDSAIVRRCASTSITTIVSNSRKVNISLSLVLEYLTDQLSTGFDYATPSVNVVLGTLITLRLLIPFIPPSLQNDDLSDTSSRGPDSDLRKLLEIFELCIQNSIAADHNLATAALETLQQLLKHSPAPFISILKDPLTFQQSRTATTAVSTTSSNWNLAPLTTGDESHLLESEVSLNVFGGDQSLVVETDVPDYSTHTDVPESFAARWNSEAAAAEEQSEVVSAVTESVEKSETNSVATNEQLVDIGSLRDSPSPLVYCARHLAFHFLLTAEKHVLKSDRSVRVAVKNLAMACLSLIGQLEPVVWNLPLSKTDQSNPVLIIDVLQYADHPDPQLRGQCAYVASSIFKSATYRPITTTNTEQLLNILSNAVRDRAAVTCRLALQGIRMCLPCIAEHSSGEKINPVVRVALEAASNAYWLVKVELLELIGEIPWMSVFDTEDKTQLWDVLQHEIFDSVYLQSLGDEDHRVRMAAAQSLVSFICHKKNANFTAEYVRVRNLTSMSNPDNQILVAGTRSTVNNIANAFVDVPVDHFAESNLKSAVEDVVEGLSTSSNKFTKIGCIQALVALSEAYPPSSYPGPYNCGNSGGYIHLITSLMTCSHLMLDLTTHQALLSLSMRLFAGNVKATLKDGSIKEEKQESWQFLKISTSQQASSILNHLAKILCAFNCAVEDVQPSTAGSKQPLVNLPNPSVLSPIRRKAKGFEAAEDKSEDRKTSKMANQGPIGSLGSFTSNPLYLRLYDTIKGHYVSYKRSFDFATSDRIVGFLKVVLEGLSTVLEVATYQDIAQYSEELLGYLKSVIVVEPQSTLYAVQQLLKSLFGVNLAGLLEEDSGKLRSDSGYGRNASGCKSLLDFCVGEDNQLEFYGSQKIPPCSPSSYSSRSFSPEKTQKNKILTKFRTAGKSAPDKTALGSFIRIFEPMVIKALKMYTTTSCSYIQRAVLDLLCELIHLCVNYCLLDADQVFLNFVLQQLEFLEEGYITDVDVLLPSIFRFLSLLSYDRFHSKSVIAVPRIIRICGGLMATGKDPQLYVLPALGPMVDDLFLAKERLEEHNQELDTQREVLICMMLRLMKYHKVYPLLLTVLERTRAESTVKWTTLSKQICESLIPHISSHDINITNLDALQLLSELLCNLASSAVHESLIGLLQTFSPVSRNSFHEVLAGRSAVLEYLMTAYDEPFMLDCLGEFNLNYLVNKDSDPLNVSTTKSLPELVLANVLVDNMKTAALEIEKMTKFLSFENKNWKPDSPSPLERIGSHFVLQLLRIANSETFPRIKKALNAEVSDAAFITEMSQRLKTIANFSPVFVIQVSALVPAVIQFLQGSSNNPGLNSRIVRKGLLVLQCVQKRRDGVPSEGALGFWNLHWKPLLELLDDPHVLEFVRTLFHESDGSQQIADIVGSLSSVSGMFAFLKLYEVAPLKNLSRSTIPVLEQILEKNSSDLTSKACEAVCSKVSACEEITLEDAEEMHQFVSKYKCFGSITKELRRIAKESNWTLETPKFTYQGDIQETWALEFILQSAAFRLSTKETSMLVSSMELEQLERLLDDSSFAQRILKSSIHPKDVAKLVLVGKKCLLRKMKNACDVSKFLEAAGFLNRVLNLSPNWKWTVQFTEDESEELAKFLLKILQICAVVDMGRGSLILTLCGRIFQTHPDTVSFYEKPEFLPEIQKSLQGLVDFLSSTSNCVKVPRFCEILHTMESINGHEDLKICIQNAASLFDWMENNQWENLLPGKLATPLKTVVLTLSRLPFFYSFLMVPPSVWEKDWNPVTSLDYQTLRLGVPVVPAQFLQDEVTFKQFIYRIRTLGWVSRHNFEEIWMSVLGILSLRNDPDLRQDEQHCITLVTCQAVVTLTALLQQNLLVPRSGNPVSRKYLHISRDPHLTFFTTERGEKLRKVFELANLTGNCDNVNLERLYNNRANEYGLSQLSFEQIENNLRNSANKSQNFFQQFTSTDLESCIHFMVDLYMQWLNDPETPYALLLDVFRSLLIISDFFTDTVHFLWLLEQSLVFYRRILPEDPSCLESPLVGCILKSAAFVQMDSGTWDEVRRVAESSLSSSNVSTRVTCLHGILCILQRCTKSPDVIETAVLVNLVMDYITKYLGTENAGMDWHQSLLWACGFYCAENFANNLHRSSSVIDCVVRYAVNTLLDSKLASFSIHRTILQGLERLCDGEKVTPSTRRMINKEIINIVRNANKPQLFEPSLRILLTLMYTDLPLVKESNPTSDPETMLVAMEWIGVLFHRLKTGSDCEARVLSDVLVAVVSDFLPAADILNRLLAEFMSAEPRVAKFLVPTVFQVFQNACKEGQQPIVLEWILLSLSNFTRISSSSVPMGFWNICCLFAAASTNQWLKVLFPFVNQPVDPDNPYEAGFFLTALMDFSSQLEAEQKKTLVAVVSAAKDKNPLYVTAADLLGARR